VAGLAVVAGFGSLTLIPTATHAEPRSSLVRAGAGADADALRSIVDAFRADLGGSNNGVGGTFSDGRREINWDGVPDTVAAPNALPADFFNKNSARGAVFRTDGDGFQVSAKADNPTQTPVRFGNLDASYPDAFSVFSPERLFVATGSPWLEVDFFVPGTDTAATVRGFGAVFTDVDYWGAAAIEYLNSRGQSLGVWVVPPSPNGGLSFLGVSFGDDAEHQVAHVRMLAGTAALAPGVVDGPRADLVAMDDFVYGEPRPLAVTPW
jgi:hypothetical protein